MVCAPIFVLRWTTVSRPSLPFGFAVTEAIALKRTMSDDGTRLTRVDFQSGAIGRGGETPYEITGYMRQPAGRAPKDTFELTVK